MILFLTQCFPSRIGGIESLVSNLALSLSEKEKVIVFADRYNIFFDEIFDNYNRDKILVRRIGGLKFFRRRKKIKDVKNFIEKRKVKLIIGDSWKSLELGIDYFKKKNIPLICLAHGNELFSKDKNKKNRITKTLNLVNTIVANSNFTKELVKKFVNPEINLVTIYPGASDIRKINKNEISTIIGSPILLTLARLEKRKGHLKIIETINKLLPDFPKIQYIIAGSGSELRNLEKIVKEKKLEKNVVFVGNVNESQKSFLFEKTDLMIMPTLDERHNRSIEGFGIAYIEAAFFSIPSIASNVGGTPEAVIDNVTGRIISSIDELYPSIRDLLINNNMIKKLGHNAKKRALDEFTWDHISKKYLLLINKITKINS